MSVPIMRSYFFANLIDQDAINGSLVHDEIRELQPDVTVERYLDAKYYQHPPDSAGNVRV